MRLSRLIMRPFCILAISSACTRNNDDRSKSSLNKLTDFLGSQSYSTGLGCWRIFRYSGQMNGEACAMSWSFRFVQEHLMAFNLILWSNDKPVAKSVLRSANGIRSSFLIFIVATRRFLPTTRNGVTIRCMICTGWNWTVIIWEKQRRNQSTSLCCWQTSAYARLRKRIFNAHGRRK